MILIDYSNLVHRTLFASVATAERDATVAKVPKGMKHKTEDIKPFFLHLLFSSLKHLKDTFSNGKEDIVICVDSSSWRKDYYPDYKSKRSESRDTTTIDFKEFYPIIDETIEVIKESFPFTVVKTYKAEADDIIAVLAEKFSPKEKVVVISCDKDFKQLLKLPMVQLYQPIKKEFVKRDDKLNRWFVEHIIGGDSIDGIPTIKTNTEFTKEFMKYLTENGIHITDVYQFNKLSISKKLYAEYTGVDKKGKPNIFKPALFGEVGIRKFVDGNIREQLKENKMFRENLKRNKKLIDFKYIPLEIKENILKSYEPKSTCNLNKIKKYFLDNNLRYLANNADEFCSCSNGDTSSIDDWF